VSVVGVPKTIDNDLSATEVTFGFHTAVQIATDAIDRLHTTAESHDRVMVVEVMGRHAGWIAAAVGLADDAATPIPLVLLFPEIAFDEAKFVAAVDARVRQFGYCCIGVSEGLKSADGNLLAEAGTTDAFGHAQLGGVGPLIANIVKQRLGLKYHWAVADYLQRAARHLASKTDLDQAYAVGKAAVELAMRGQNAVMPAILRVSDAPYRWKIGIASLEKVANFEKKLPRDYISADGLGITAKARRYLSPLIRGEAFPPFRDGLPRYVRLKNVAVPKRLATEFKL
jgi:6-phosphofructokinase 1